MTSPTPPPVDPRAREAFNPVSEAAYFASIWKLSEPQRLKLEKAFQDAQTSLARVHLSPAQEPGLTSPAAHNGHFTDPLADREKSATSPAQPPVAEYVTERLVKPLVWHEYPTVTHDYGRGVFDANSVTGGYSIWDCSLRKEVSTGEWLRYYCREVSLSFDTLDEAKAAADAHNRTRILSALDATVLSSQAAEIERLTRESAWYKDHALKIAALKSAAEAKVASLTADLKSANEALRKWYDARKAFLDLERADTRSSEEARAALERLSKAENALFAAARSLQQGDGT